MRFKVSEGPHFVISFFGVVGHERAPWCIGASGNTFPKDGLSEMAAPKNRPVFEASFTL
jgi:hypothetical protein